MYESETESERESLFSTVKNGHQKKTKETQNQYLL